jgi:hypothetical protein
VTPSPLGRQGPLNEHDAAALLAEARRTLEELAKVANDALEQARAAIGGGRSLQKAEVKALNRAASLARYVADCAHRASWEPPKAKRQAGWGFNEPLASEPQVQTVNVVEARIIEPNGYASPVELTIGRPCLGRRSIEVRNVTDTLTVARVVLELNEDAVELLRAGEAQWLSRGRRPVSKGVKGMTREDMVQTVLDDAANDPYEVRAGQAVDALVAVGALVPASKGATASEEVEQAEPILPRRRSRRAP